MKNTKIKLLVCLVIAALAFSVMAIGSFAAGTAVAKIGDTEYTTLAEAVEAANAMTGDVTITLVADANESVTVVRKPDLNLTIDGGDNTLNGAINIDGKSATYTTGSLTVKNVNFDATGISEAACINFGGSNPTRYITNVTVEDCTFTGGARAKAAIKSYTGGDKAIAVAGCTVDNTMHSLLQVVNVTGLEIDGCTVESKNGLNIQDSSDVVIKNSDINVSGYAVRIGQGSGNNSAPVVTLTDNTISTDGTEGDAAIIIRGSATDAVLSMEKNAVTTEGGVAHIGVNLADTADVSISADANYWGEEISAPVAEGMKVNVTNSYADPDCTDLVEGGSIVAYIGDVYYFSFEEAFAAAVSGDVIKLTANVKTTTVLNFKTADLMPRNTDCRWMRRFWIMPSTARRDGCSWRMPSAALP